MIAAHVLMSLIILLALTYGVHNRLLTACLTLTVPKLYNLYTSTEIGYA